MASLLGFLTSIHVAPSLIGIAAAGGLYATGTPEKTCAIVAGAGLAVSGAVFLMEPIRTLRSKSNTFHVGIREVPGDAAAGLPPITVFYPTTVAPSSPSTIPFLPFGDDRYTQGLAAYAHVPAFLLRDLRWNRVRATMDAEPVPLHAKDSISDAPRTVVLFSHGLGSYGRFQTRLHLELAARGAIVVAMTHMDGSAAFCRDADGTAIAIPVDAKAQNTPEDREPMLALRVKETLAALLRIQSGRLFRDIGYEDFTVRAMLTTGIRVTLAGHSFGGATALATAQESYAAVKDRSIIENVVVFDPWHIPLQRELFFEPIERGEKPYLFPTLQFFSEEWTRDTESRTFFQKLNAGLEKQEAWTEAEHARLAKDARRSKNTHWNSLRTVPHVDHRDITDISLLAPVQKKWYATRSGDCVITEYAEGLLTFARQQRKRRVSFSNS